MSDSFRQTREAFARLRTTLREADEDTRWDFGFWVAGIATMGLAIGLEFGWRGALFCFGFYLWAGAKND